MPESQPWPVLGVPIDSAGALPGGPQFGTERSPAALRELGVIGRLRALDAGDLDVRIIGPDRDAVSGMVGWPSVASAVASVRAAVTDLLTRGRRPLLLGGCCTLLMGAAAAARDLLGRTWLAYVDGHVDVYDNRTSRTGEAADMPVAALLGFGWPELLARMGPMPVIAGTDIVVLGARDQAEAADIAGLPERLGLTVYGPDRIAAGPADLGTAARSRFAGNGMPYWLHLDVDVLDEAEFPATDYLMPNGISLSQLIELMRPLAAGERLIGVSVGCYNPEKDPDRRYGTALVGVLEDALGQLT